MRRPSRIEDPRYFQIGALTLMLLFGVMFRDFSVSWGAVFAVLVTSILTQGLGIWALDLPKTSVLSALISAISLLLLCRAQNTGLLCGAAFLAIASKFVLTYHKKHFFNPTNFGVLMTCLLSDAVWVSPGQWGEGMVLAFWILMMGSLVVVKSFRLDIVLAFLGTYALLLLLRVVYLGQVWAVLGHQLSSGALILFSFFMISDPRSTPDHRLGRILFAVLVAGLAFLLRFTFFHPQAILWALFLCSPITIVIDRFLKARRFEWRSHEKKSPSPAYAPSPA